MSDEVLLPYVPGMPDPEDEDTFIAKSFGRGFTAHNLNTIFGTNLGTRRYQGQDMPDTRPIDGVRAEMASPAAFADYIEKELLDVPFDPAQQSKYDWHIFDDDPTNSDKVASIGISPANGVEAQHKLLTQRELSFRAKVSQLRTNQWASADTSLIEQLTEQFYKQVTIEPHMEKYLWQHVVTRDPNESIRQFANQSQAFRSWVGIRGVDRLNSSLHWVSGDFDLELPIHAGHIVEPEAGMEWGYAGTGPCTTSEILMKHYAQYARMFGRDINPYLYDNQLANYMLMNVYSHDAPIERVTEFHAHYLEIQDFVVDASIQMLVDSALGQRQAKGTPLRNLQDIVAQRLKGISFESSTGFIQAYEAAQQVRTHGFYQDSMLDRPNDNPFTNFIGDLDRAIAPVIKAPVTR